MSNPTKAELFTEVALGIARLNGLLYGQGERTAGKVGLTAARWSLLGTIVRAGEPLTVPEIARRGGQARQGIQRLVNAMIADELVCYQDNPGHVKSKKVALTDKGSALYHSLRERQERWSARRAEALSGDDLQNFARLIRNLIDQLDPPG